MKKILSLILCIALALISTGCTELEIKHFDKTMYNNMTGVYNVDETITVTIDPKTLGEAVIDISNKMTDIYNVNNNTEDENVITDNNNKEAQEFLDQFLSEIRVALDENKMFSYSINVKGISDFDKYYADTNIALNFNNNISIDCGKSYARGEKVFIDKKLFYTIGSISYIYDIEMLNQYYNALDNILGESQYLVVDYDKMGNLSSGISPLSIVDSTNILNQIQIDYYEKAKEVLSGFDSGCVSEIENGTRFEIKPGEFTNFCKRFASYIRQHSEPASSLVNDYMSLIFATSMSMYGADVIDSDMMNSMLDEMNVTSEDIITAMDEFKLILNSPEWSTIFNTLNISYVNDITGDNNNQHNVMSLKGLYNTKTAFSVETDMNIEKTENYEFYDISNSKTMDYSDFLTQLTKAQMDILYGYNNTTIEYICPDCGESFMYFDTHYCNECGFEHNFYEGDSNCDKQPGCELARETQEAVNVIA